MRAARNDQTGNIGETEVTAKFERLEWGVAPNPRHDLGTDLWLMARDARLFDLGLVVGAQVKTGPTFFAEEARDGSGALIGWWFRDTDRQHIDAWLAHGLPHLIVLHDLGTQTSYWAHVSPEVVIGTGKGAKILVPATNTVDEAQRDDLLRVAASKKSSGTWEGSAWSGATSVPTSALLRHALIVPRLVAPHPNAGERQSVSPAQALALLVQARLNDLREDDEQHKSAPGPDRTAAGADWDWRLVDAMAARVTREDVHPLVDVARDAPDPARRSAATAAAAAAMLEGGRAADAAALLSAALHRDDAEPVDHAWLIVQQARAAAELGRREQARDLAAQAQSIGSTHAEDVTATALAGTAAILLFNNTEWVQSDVSALIAGSDTTATWWRTQTVSRGLTALTQRTFRAWARDTSVRITTGDEINDQLFSAALTASHVGDHATWRHLTSLLGQDGLLRLDRDADPDNARAAVETLRLAGNVDALKHAVRRLADDGPAAAVTLAAAQVVLDQTTRTTAPATLALLEQGGDLLDQPTADRTVHWLLATLADGTTFSERTHPTYSLDMRLIQTLSRVVPAASSEAQGRVAAWIAQLSPQGDQLLALSWASTARALIARVWDPATARAAGRAADAHHPALGTPLLGIASRFNPDIRQRLLADATGGDLDALQALGDVAALPADIVQAVISAQGAQLRQLIDRAERGEFRMTVHDPGHIVAMLNTWHPALATWAPLVELIAHPLVAGRHKDGATWYLAAAAARIPRDIRDSLLSAARTATTAATRLPASFSKLVGSAGGSLGALSELVAALTEEDDSADPVLFTDLLAGDTEARVSAARIARRLRRPEDIGILLVLATDFDPHVRTAAARGCAELAAEGVGGSSVLAAVRRCCGDPGRLAPTAVAVALSRKRDIGPEAAELLEDLRHHRSARVRRAASAPPDE